jgi:xanthine dehydrogenase accessory factor
MDSVDIEVLRLAEQWRKSGRKVALGTIVKTWGSAPRPVGAMVAVRDDGQVVGSVSGGCVEDDLMDKVRAKLPTWKTPELFTYGVTNEEATRWGLPCGGTLQLVMEPVSDQSRIADLLDRVTKQQLVKRRLEMESGKASLEPGRWQDVLEFDGRVLSTVHGPRWRLVLIGAGQLTRYLAEMARMLDYHVAVIDPREEYAAGWDLAAVPLNRSMPDDVVRELELDGHSALVALTHDPKLDDLALMEARRVLRRRPRLEEEQRCAPRAAARVRPLRRRDRAPARPGGPVHRLEDAARDRGGDPRRDDCRAPRGERAELGRQARTPLRPLGV